MKRDFVQALQEAERAREGAELRPGAAYRISEAARAGSPDGEGRRRLWVVATALALPLVAFIAFFISQPGDAPPRMRTARMMADEAPRQELLTVTSPDGRIALADGAWKFDEGQRLHVGSERGAVLRREEAGLRVVEGVARFDVQTRAAGEAEVVVLVSHGRIEVLGTQFTVVQREDGGEVTLHEGRIRFRAEDGREAVLMPGESLRWPLPQLAEVVPEAPAAAPVPVAPEQQPEQQPEPRAVPQRRAPVRAPEQRAGTPQPGVDVEALISELEVLRRQGKFEDAASRLQATLRRDLPSGTAERLSYELGSILTWQLRDAARGCEVWADHRQKHGSAGRYGAEVTRAERALGCR